MTLVGSQERNLAFMWSEMGATGGFLNKRASRSDLDFNRNTGLVG